MREARRRAGLSQAELAARLATTQSVIARWESGATSPSFDTVLRVVRACGLDLSLSLVEQDPDHDRLIGDYLGMPLGQRLSDLLDRLQTESRLQSARRVS